MQAVVDRITENLAVIHFEGKQFEVHVPVEILPENTKEGSWLKIHFELDEEKTTEMYKRNKSLLERLIKRGKQRDNQ